MPIWDPNQYLKFNIERTQPSLDLISRIALDDPATIIDVGCGPGNSTAALRTRWPRAEVSGLDSSDSMIAAARAGFPQGEWIAADAAVFNPERQYNLVFSNATLQWLRHHEVLLPHLFGWVAAGGALAVQAPVMEDSPLTQAVRAVAAKPSWRDLTAGCETLVNYRSAEYYYPILRSLGPSFELWQTTYYHVLASHQGLMEWYRGTGMKPFLDRLPDEPARAAFQTQVLEAVIPHYPLQTDGRVLFPFKRLFFTVYKTII